MREIDNMQFMAQSGQGAMRAAFGALSAIAVIAVAILAIAPAAWASIVLEAPVEVSDDVTHFQVYKLDASTHEFVKGAALCIVEKDSGQVVDEWTSEESFHEVEKVLDVDTVYVLKELEAPDGYYKASSVEFKLNAEEGSGIELISGDDAELAGDYGLNLYDTRVQGEKVVHKTREVVTNRTVAPRTGDETPLGLVIGLAITALVAAGVLQIAKRRLND